MLVSAETVSPPALTGVAALLSMKASESVVSTATAMPAPEPASEESAVDVTLVVRLEVMATLPVPAEIEAVSESWLLAVVATWTAVTEASLVLAFSQFAESECGAVVSLLTSFLASYRLPSAASVTTSPFL